MLDVTKIGFFWLSSSEFRPQFGKKKQTTLSTLLLPLSPVSLLRRRPPSAAAAPAPFNRRTTLPLSTSKYPCFYFLWRRCFSAVFDFAADESACADSSSIWEFRRWSQQRRQFIHHEFDFFCYLEFILELPSLVQLRSFYWGFFFQDIFGCLPVRNVIQCVTANCFMLLQFFLSVLTLT